MEKATNNPLFKHFRQPAIYLKLPSQGRFYPDGSLQISVTGDIPIYPMTVKDELTLKTPDALMNGEGMAAVIRSCCPTILDPWQIPAVDLDAIFIAIRLASYGTGMDVNTSCPKCKEENDALREEFNKYKEQNDKNLKYLFSLIDSLNSGSIPPQSPYYQLYQEFK
jgi:hypothetical protein